jgi:hypothetical protein
VGVGAAGLGRSPGDVWGAWISSDGWFAVMSRDLLGRVSPELAEKEQDVGRFFGGSPA